MDITFSEALERLNREAQAGNAALEMARDARPSEDYVLQQILPERLEPTYKVESGNMIIRSTMAGAVGMDSDFPEGGVITASEFLQSTSKFGNAVTIPEKALRKIQQLQQSGSNIDMVQEAINFIDKLLIQPHMDTFEYLRGQILTTGKIDWKFNKKKISVDYGIPSENKLSNRTGTSAYDGTDSKFWDDIYTMQKQQNYDVQEYLCHQDTMNTILANSANAIRIESKESYKYGSVYEIVKLGELENSTVASSDARDRIRIRTYIMEGELIDPTDKENTIKKPFLSAGKLVAIGSNDQRGYRVGQGSTEDPIFDNALGYTHIGPTVEGNGQPGRYARAFTPEAKPMQLRGEGATNGLPVVEVPQKISIASTDIPS
ncbi:major capsid protein [Fodinibius sp.]|uniref:major capsid protein n=1 Tax=Fodinibius sp. TaxID=1872440 RepID=UPI002ACDFEC7|nr:major capsid protein [Fodinibius sp.]MDZ7658074.1 major capsid protein [Fodinibius sp.]